VLALAAAALVLSPATVSFPVAVAEVVVLAVGLAAMLVLNFALLRRALSPLEGLRGADARRRSVAAGGAGAGGLRRAGTESGR
jgi:hypothetical protein